MQDQKDATDANSAFWTNWTQAQEQGLKAWADLAAGAMPAGFGSTAAGAAHSGEARAAVGEPQDQGAGAKRDFGAWGGGGMPEWPGFEQYVAAWRRMTEEGLAAGMGGADPSLRGLADQARTAQEASMRLYAALAESWQRMAGQEAGGADWSAMLAKEARRIQMRMMPSPVEWAGNGEDIAELWRLYMASIGRMLGPWGEAMAGGYRAGGGESSPADPFGMSGLASMGQAGFDPAQQRAAFNEASDRAWQAWDQVVDAGLSGPRIGINRKTEEMQIRGFEAWRQALRDQQAYQRVLSEAWGEAFEAAMNALMQRAQAGDPVNSLRELSQVWIAESDKVLEARLAEAPYAEAQGAMVASLMRYRIAEREIVDAMLASSPIASRSELDEAYRAIQELKREMRALRREMSAAVKTAAKAPVAAKPAAKAPAAAKPATKKPAARKSAAKPTAAKKPAALTKGASA
jgi:hypothetical protein